MTEDELHLASSEDTSAPNKNGGYSLFNRYNFLCLDPHNARKVIVFGCGLP